MLTTLPGYAPQYQEESKNYSVRQILEWQCPGDLIAWENFQFHCSSQLGSWQYDRTAWVKEFISIETYVR
jgi:hypothetical protein